ncbi:SDR family NAD(P)-dependent oxidoreductase [Nitratireductor soli]|uniref:SDR family NAD(P)-dependent oxidoreductase n=1 Tax=Nitratireductor soli TaxID=1670619 RepID=UPI00065DD662|nr:SDR family NAD(P)-dependent oxidoreductase [Nitratireductor soli]
MERELDGKVAIVTGGAQGIGKACIEALAVRGAEVVIADIDGEAGERLARTIDSGGGKAVSIACDVGSMASMEAMAAAAEARFGGIDILVNNAACALSGVVDAIDEALWQSVINTNLTGVWRGMKVCVPSMRRRGGGVIVNMSSVQALVGFAGWPAYAAAKGGIDALTRQTAIDLASAGIRVNAVAPGTIMTPMNERIFAEVEDAEALRRSWNEAHPIGRFGQPEEVAETVAFLAGPRASFITGEIVRVDGGLAIRGE